MRWLEPKRNMRLCAVGVFCVLAVISRAMQLEAYFRIRISFSEILRQARPTDFGCLLL